MKFFLFASLLCVLSALSCKKSEEALYKSELDKSYQVWLKFKSESKNNYEYTQSYDSWTGTNTNIKITVRNGGVVERSYEIFVREIGNSEPVLKESWAEDAASLNSHIIGLPIYTLDQVYEQAKQVWLNVSPKENDIYFEAKNNGMISSAGFVPKGCQDDCFRGIRITSIKTLKP